MKRPTPRPSRLEDVPPLAQLARAGGVGMLSWLLPAYGGLMVIGALVLHLPGAMTGGNELTFDRLIFTVIDAATLTGFQTNVGLNQANSGSVLVPATVLLLTLGGTLFSLIAGGAAMVRILRLPYTDEQIVSSAMITTLIATLAGTAALVGSVPRAYDAVLLSLSAFGNSGINAGSVPRVDAWQTHLVLMPLAVIGGLGLPVLMELYDRLVTRKPLSTHARTVLWLMAGVYLAGFVLLLFSRPQFWQDLFDGLGRLGWTSRQSARIRYDLVSSSVGAINSRTAGLPFEYAGTLPRATQWVVLLLMMVGGHPAGTAGGVKGITLLTLVRGVRDALAGRRVPRTVGVAGTWFGGYLLIVALAFAALLLQVPELPTDQLLFLSVSAASNAGLSHDLLSLVGPGLFTLSLTMLLGRLAPLLVLWWMAQTTRDADVAVG